MQKIIIDCGHHSSDPGAVANNTNEHKEVLRTGKSVMNELGKTTIDHVMVPTDLSLSGKIKWVNANSVPGDLLISLHMNAASPQAHGAEVYYETGNSLMAQTAQKFLDTYTRATGQVSRGIKGDTTTRHGRLGILRDVRCKALLIELGFLTNREELEIVRTHATNALMQSIFTLLNYKPMPEDNTPVDVPFDQLASWEKTALGWGKNAIGFKTEWARSPITRVEAIEMLRKFELYLLKK